VSLFLSFSLVSIFFIAERVTFLLKRLLAVPLQVASPEITRRWELGRREELRHDIGFLIKVQLAVAILFAALVAAAAEVAVLIVSDASFLAAAGLLRILTVSVVLMAAYAPITTLLRAIDRIGLALASDVIWLGFYVGVGVALMPHLGLEGIVLAHLTASAVTTAWNVAAGDRAARIAWDGGGLARVLLVGLLVAVPGYAAAKLVAPAHPVAELAIALLVLFAYNLLLPLAGALTAHDRRRFAELAGQGRVARVIDAALFWPLRLRSGGAR
jgi:O-antigen/teichoic acid export membrane protein